MKIRQQRQTEPVAYVTNGRQRLKQHTNNSVYLNNGNEFELELFNPTTFKVLAKIHLNGNSIGAGIVLQPGQRAFIERYLDSPNKFKFNTYEVEGEDSNVKRAIVNNGSVQVKFYKEDLPVINTSWITNWPTFGDYSHSGNNGIRDYSPPTTTLGGPGTNINSTFTCNSLNLDKDYIIPSSNSFSGEVSLDALDFAPQEMCRSIADLGLVKSIKSRGRGRGRKLGKTALQSKSVETGRIDKGSVSNQKFKHDYSEFETYYTWMSEWKILPMSTKPILTSEIKVFCTGCGAKKKRGSHKFCPNCGSKY